MQYTGLGMRIVAGIIDIIVGYIIGLIVALATGQASGIGYSLSGAPALITFVLYAAYFIVLEGTTGQTVGKMVVGARVMKPDGSPLGLGGAAIRNVLRIIDGLPFAYIIGIILIATSDKKQRLGDRLAGSIVAQKASVTQPAM